MMTYGIGGAIPVKDVDNLNVQVEGSYSHGWSNDYNHFSPNLCSPPKTTGTPCAASYGDSREVWNFGFSPFLAYAGSRWGLNLNYETITHFGHITNGGAFMEWYLSDQITVSAKGGYLHTGGTPFGGHGHYLAAAGTYYFMPDLAVTASIDWQDVTTGGALANSANPAFCRRSCMLDIGSVFFGLEGEWLASPDLGLSVFGSFTYSSDTVFKQDDNSTIWRVGLKYYTGQGSLVERQRNGTVRDWLRRP